MSNGEITKLQMICFTRYCVLYLMLDGKRAI